MREILTIGGRVFMTICVSIKTKDAERLERIRNPQTIAESAALALEAAGQIIVSQHDLADVKEAEEHERVRRVVEDLVLFLFVATCHKRLNLLEFRC
jgi:hypothetical protein